MRLGYSPVGLSCQPAVNDCTDSPPPAPSVVSVGVVSPASTTTTPPLSWPDATTPGCPVARYEARLVRPVDNSVLLDWTPSAANQPLTGLNLDSTTIVFAEVRSVDPQGRVSTATARASLDPASHDCRGARLTNSPYAGGTGDILDPFTLCTPAQLNQIALHVRHHHKVFRQDADFDMSGIDYRMIGAERAFTGWYLGNHHTIRNLTLDAQATDWSAFIARSDTGAAIYDLTFDHPAILNGAAGAATVFGSCEYTHAENIVIHNGEVRGTSYAGLFAGYAGDCG